MRRYTIIIKLHPLSKAHFLMSNRSIIHVDMDAFFASVEQRDFPHLRGKPVIVGGSSQGRGVVCAASYEARVFGVHSAMPMKLAVQKCPQGYIMPVRGNVYGEVSKQIKDIFFEFTPHIEPLSIDEAFLDVTGSEALLGDAQAIGKAIQKKIWEETELVASIGISHNKFLAKLASDLEKPNGFVVIDKASAQDILDPLDIKRIWGVGKVCANKLNQIGICTIYHLRNYPRDLLQKTMGNQTDHLIALANGNDLRSVTPSEGRKSISKDHTFEKDVVDNQILRNTLFEQIQHIATILRQEKMFAKTVTIKIRNHVFQTITRSVTLDSASDETEVFWQAAKSLFTKYRQTNHILPTRLIGIGLSQLSNSQSGIQLSLFEDKQQSKMKKIDQLIDTINNKFGSQTMVRRANNEC